MFKIRKSNQITNLAADKRGVIIVMIALLLPIMMGFIGLGVEVGYWFSEKRSLQGAADAAAVSAAYSYANGNTTNSDLLTAATTDATRNGYTSTTDTIAAANPPGSGSYTADANAIEVTMTRNVSLIFAQLVTSFSDDQVTVNARAVATQSSIGEACVLALDTTDEGISVSGNGDVSFDGCLFAANSSDDDALSVTGSGDLTVDCYSVVGGVDESATLTLDSDCSPQTNAFAISDPYASLEDPDDGDCDDPGGFTHNSNTSITYPVSGSASYSEPYVICGDFWIKKGTVTMDSGLYVIKGDIKANATGTLNNASGGVTIVLKDGGQIDNFNGSSTVVLSAPSDSSAGDWQGILFYQDRDTSSSCTGNNCNTLNGNSSSSFNGVVYFPNQEIQISGGNSGSSTCLQIVALRVSFTGNSDVNGDNSTCSSSGVSAINVPGPITLVE